MRRHTRFVWSLAAALLIAAGPGVAQPAPPAGTDPADVQRELEGVGIEEQLGHVVSADIPFVNSEGKHVQLGDYFDGERPVVLTFAYHSCPMLCSLLLDGLTKTLSEANLDLGQDYQVVVVSFDAQDTPERAAEVKARYEQRLGDPDAAAAIQYLTGTEENIARLTEEVGFGFRWVPEQQEFAHTASLLFLSPERTVTRYLYGIQYAAADFRKAVLEAGEGKIGSPVDQLLLYCFVYDPNAGSYVLHATNAMKLAGLATLLLLGGFLLFYWRRERHHREEVWEGAPAS